jgi:signal transduction histidine kinase
MLKLLAIPGAEIKRPWSNKYLAVSFAIWALLQFLLPLKRLFDFNEKSILLLGFGTSTIVKLAILYALFKYYNNIANDATLKQRRENMALRKNNQDTDELQFLINEVSAQKTTQDIIKVILKHFTSSNVFKFDYAMFSYVNYLDQRIEYKSGKTNLNFLKINDWVLSDGIALNHHDIMAQTVRDKKVHHFYADFMNGKKIDIESPESPLNRNIYITHKHLNLDRFFIPVLKLPTTIKKEADGPQFQDDRVTALIEIGNWRPGEESSKNKQFNNIGQLNIYIDNCAQSYRRSVEEEIGKDIQEIITKCDTSSEDDYKKYLTYLIEGICTYIHADYGLISILPYNNIIQDYEKLFFHFNINDHQIARLKKVFQEVIRDREENEQTIAQSASHICDRIAHNISMLQKTPTYRKIPIFADGATVGNIYIFSKKDIFFNEDIEIVIDKIREPIFKLYNEKKFHAAVAESVKPNIALTEPEENMLPIIYSISDYFFTPYVSIWLRVYQPHSNKEYVQKYATKELEQGCRYYGKKTIIIDEFPEISEYEFTELDTANPTDKNNNFHEFGKRNHLKSFIHVPLVANMQQYGFINIYFKNVARRLFLEDIQFLRLIATKGLMTIQMQQLVSGFRAISASFTKKDLQSTLQIISDKAMEVLNSDPVILFKSENATDVYFKDVTYSNYDDFKDPIILELFKKRAGHVDLAELIVKEGTKYFNTESEYVVFMNTYKRRYERTHFKEDFWHREDIKSMAAIQLMNKINDKTKVVGVMFINFRKQVTFNEEAKKVIQTFASLAADAIESGYIAEKERQYFVRNYMLAAGVQESILTRGMLHNASKSFTAVDATFDLLQRNVDRKEMRTHMHTLDTAINQLRIHFERIHELYRPDTSLKINSHDIRRIMNEQLEVMEQRFSDKFIKIELEYNIATEIECDGKELAQVFYNLLNNSYEAMKPRGTLQVKIYHLDEKDIQIDIIDDGRGIPKDIYDEIMFPFVSSKREEGSGLGLAISRIRILQHGGHIRYTSKPKRTIFTIILPIHNKSI